jgi:hypothetical protein
MRPGRQAQRFHRLVVRDEHLLILVSLTSSVQRRRPLLQYRPEAGVSWSPSHRLFSFEKNFLFLLLSFLLFSLLPVSFLSPKNHNFI